MSSAGVSVVVAMVLLVGEGEEEPKTNEVERGATALAAAAEKKRRSILVRLLPLVGPFVVLAEILEAEILKGSTRTRSFRHRTAATRIRGEGGEETKRIFDCD